MRALSVAVVAAFLLSAGCGESQPRPDIGSSEVAEPGAAPVAEPTVADVAEAAPPARAEVDASGEERCREPEGVPPESIVVRMCGRVLTVDDLLDRLEVRSPSLRQRYREPAALREALSRLVRFEILVAEAERRGLDESPTVRRAREQALVRQLVRSEIDEAPGSGVSEITDEEVEAYYAEHPDEYDWPERVKVGHIQVSDRALGERLLADVLAAPEDADLFARLAAEHSEDAGSRGRGGELPYAVRPEEGRPEEPELPAELAEAAFSLEKKGDIHPELVQSPSGWHIVKLVGRRPAVRATPQEARRMIRNKLWRELREQRIETLVQAGRERLNVEIDEEALERLRSALEEAPAVPNSPAARRVAPGP